MINFIIYETSERLKREYELVILNFVGIREEQFKIYNYKDGENKNNNNIYIISHLNLKSAIKIAKKIRDTGNWKSQIILISKINKNNIKLLKNKLLILDYIDINDNYNNLLKEDLCIAYKILTNDKTLNFCLNNEINKIPYNNILYIEKNNNQNYCTIITKNNTYIIKETITSLEKKLDSTLFMKTHRSCIVNLRNISQYNCSKNIVTFTNKKEIDLISRDKRKILKQRLIEERIKEK